MKQINTLTDYQRMAAAIEFLVSHQQAQPGLSELAQFMELSPGHVQKLFTRWAGISPRRFLQFLNQQYACRQMQYTRNLLELTFETGLSSPGRLHDLFVQIEAMTPGEYQRGGEGLTIRYTLGPTPFGVVLLATTSRGICACQFAPDACAGMLPENRALHQWGLQTLQAQWPAARYTEDAALNDLIQGVFSPLANAQAGTLTLHLKGTNFQLQVWRALLAIPSGGLMSYGDFAEQLGKPTAARAVGSAIGKNPVAYLIPCHRVLRASGEPGGYRWGLTRKRAVQIWETQTKGALSPNWDQ